MGLAIHGSGASKAEGYPGVHFSKPGSCMGSTEKDPLRAGIWVCSHKAE